MILSVIYIFCTYFLSSLVVFLLLFRIFKLRQFLNPGLAFALMLGLGPLIISYLLYIGFLLFPNHGNGFYIGFVIIIFLLMLLASLKEYKLIKDISSDALQALYDIKHWYFWEYLYLALIVFTLLIVFPQAMLLPLSSDDGSIYHTIARIFYEQKSLYGYPFIQAHPATGLYSTASHPPAFQMLYIWGFLFQGNVDLSPVIQSTSPMFYLLDIIAIYCLVKKNLSRSAGLIAASIFASTPAIIITSSINFIDSFRLYPLIFSIFWLAELAKITEKKYYPIILSALGLALSIFTHASHIFIVPILIFAFLIASKLFLRVRVKYAVIMAMIAIIIGGIGYLVNYLRFDHIIVNFFESEFTPRIFELQSKSLLRARDQLNWWDVIRNGRLQDFFCLSKWGITVYLVIISLFYWIKSNNKNASEWFMLIFGIGFYIFVKDPFSITNNEHGYGIWSSWRYLLPIMITNVYFSARFLANAYQENIIKANLTEGINASINNKYDTTKKNNTRGYVIKRGIIFTTIIIYLIFIPLFLLSRNGEVLIEKPWKLIYKPDIREDAKKQNLIIQAITDFVNKQNNKNAVFYTFDPSYFVYSKLRGIYYIDSRLEEFYKTDDPDKKARLLSGLGVTHIFFNKYNQETRHYFYEEIQDIINDTEYSEIVYENDKVKIYRLYCPNKNLRKHIDIINFSDLANKIDKEYIKSKSLDNKKYNFVEKDKWLLISDWNNFIGEIKAKSEKNELTIKRINSLGWKHRLQRNSKIFQGKSEYFILRSPELPVKPENEYNISFTVKHPKYKYEIFWGNPKIRLYINENKKNQEPFEIKLDIILLEEESSKVKYRYKPDHNANSIAIIFKIYKIKEWVSISDIVIESIDANSG